MKGPVGKRRKEPPSFLLLLLLLLLFLFTKAVMCVAPAGGCLPLFFSNVTPLAACGIPMTGMLTAFLLCTGSTTLLPGGCQRVRPPDERHKQQVACRPPLLFCLPSFLHLFLSFLLLRLLLQHIASIFWVPSSYFTTELREVVEAFPS